MKYFIESKRGFVKADVSRAVRLRECPLRELPLYCCYYIIISNSTRDKAVGGVNPGGGDFHVERAGILVVSFSYVI